MSVPERTSSRSALRAAGSFLSALAGWSVLVLIQYVGSRFSPSDESYGWAFYAVVCAPFVLVVWLVALLPLYFCVPLRSALWRWPVCTLCGITAGTLISLVVWCVLDPSGVIERFLDFLMASLCLGGTCGGGACLFGSLTAPLFQGQQHPRFDLVPHQAIRRLKEKFSDLSGQ